MLELVAGRLDFYPKTFYLAGNINGQTLEGCNGWRLGVTRELERRGHRVLNPLRGKTCLPKGQKLTPETCAGLDVVTDGAVIVMRDLRDVEESDALIVNVGPRDAVLTGSVCEVFQAAMGKHPRIPVFAYVEDRDEPCAQARSPWFGGFFSPAYHVHVGRQALLETVDRYFPGACELTMPQDNIVEVRR